MRPAFIMGLEERVPVLGFPSDVRAETELVLALAHASGPRAPQRQPLYHCDKKWQEPIETTRHNLALS